MNDKFDLVKEITATEQKDIEEIINDSNSSENYYEDDDLFENDEENYEDSNEGRKDYVGYLAKVMTVKISNKQETEDAIEIISYFMIGTFVFLFCTELISIFFGLQPLFGLVGIFIYGILAFWFCKAKSRLAAIMFTCLNLYMCFCFSLLYIESFKLAMETDLDKFNVPVYSAVFLILFLVVSIKMLQASFVYHKKY